MGNFCHARASRNYTPKFIDMQKVNTYSIGHSRENDERLKNFRRMHVADVIPNELVQYQLK